MSNPAPGDSIPSTPPVTDKVSIGTPGEDNAPPQPPTPLTNPTPLAASLQGSLAPSASTPLVPGTEKCLEENALEQPERRRSLFRRPIFWFALAAAVVAVVLVVILPVYFTVIKPRNNTSLGGGGGPNGGNNGNPNGLTTGGDGSTVTTDNGTEFTYQNPFGGFCTWSRLFSIGEGIISQLESQGSGIRKIRSMTMLSQTRGRLLSTRRGNGEPTNSTGKRPLPHTCNLLSSCFLGNVSTYHLSMTV